MQLNEISEPFGRIYELNEWTNGSGPGSFRQSNEPFFSTIREIIEEHSIRSIVDIGCGDFQILRNLHFGGCSYHGLDVVSGVIENNQKKYVGAGTNFSLVPKALDDLPAADVYIVKDVLIHLLNADALRLLQAVRARAGMVVVVKNTANGDGVYNARIPVGGIRPVNVSRHPFDFPVQQTITYGRPWAYDPRMSLILARLPRKRVWPDIKHIQIIKGNGK